MVSIMCVCISVTPDAADTRWFIIIKGWTLDTASPATSITNLNALIFRESLNQHYEKMKWMSTKICIGFLTLDRQLNKEVTIYVSDKRSKAFPIFSLEWVTSLWIDQMDVQNHRGIKDFTPMGKVSIVILVYDNDVELVVSAVKL